MTSQDPLPDKTRKVASSESNYRDIEKIRATPPGPHQDFLINTMIEANLPLVFLKVSTYTGMYPNVAFLHNDLVSEGVLAVSLAIRHLADLPTPEDKGNPTGFIGQRIIWAITRLVDNDNKAHTGGGKKQVYACKFDDFDDGEGNTEKKQLVNQYEIPPTLDDDPMAMVDIRDALLSICQTPEDRIILKMRENGSTDQDIADRLDITRRAVCFQRAELFARYEKLIRNTR